MEYLKALVGRSSPENNCLCEDGELLVIASSSPTKALKLPKDTNYFLGVKSKKASRYGWVSTLPFPMTANQLALAFDGNPSQELIATCELLLKAAAKENVDTPMACDFSEVGILTKTRELRVHRIIFYHPK
jgi:hypothetical protein